jgi:ribosomal protein S18 acetylase RimI-like enzyme
MFHDNMAMASKTADLVPPIRHAARKMVRELGFMSKTLAGTSLSPAAVHCLIEIGDHGLHGSHELREALMLREDEFQFVLHELSINEEIYSEPAPSPALGNETLHLTAKGRATLSNINAFAIDRVQRALDAAPEGAQRKIADAIYLYAKSLEAARTTPPSPTVQPHRKIDIIPGYRPGILARTLEMHLTYYSRVFNFGLLFETEIAKDFGDVLNRLVSPVNQVWAAMETTPNGREHIVGTIFMDGEDLGRNKAHLRGFIVDEHARGLGVGKRLLELAMAFVDAHGFDETRLWTLHTLDVARHLYGAAGFVLAHQFEMTKWGPPTTVLEYVRPRVTSAAAEAAA